MEVTGEKNAVLAQKPRHGPMDKIGTYKALPLHRLPFSLGVKIFIVFILITVVGFFLTLRLSLRIIYDNIWREAQDKLKTDLKIAKLLYDHNLQEVDTVIDFTANRFFLQDAMARNDLASLKSPLHNLRRERGLDLLALTDATGTVLLRTTSPFNAGDNLSDDELVQAALKGHKSSGTVSLPKARLQLEGEDLLIQAHVAPKPTEQARPSPIREVDSGLFLMSAYPVIDPEGKLLGALYGGRLLNNNFSLVDSIRGRMFPDSVDEKINLAMVTIFFWDVRVSTTLRLPNQNRAVGSYMDGEAAESTLTNNRSWLGTSWVVFDWYFAAYEPLTDPTGKVIGALGIGRWKGPFIALRNQFIWRYVKISVVGLVVASILSAVFARMLTQPLRKLVVGTQELARGNLNFRVKIKASQDEIRDLEVAFNTMAQNLHAGMDERDRLTTQLTDLNQRYMELLGFASHEIKQPIGVIGATVSNLRKMGRSIAPDKYEKILDRLDRNISYLASMSEKYLQYAKIESGQLRLYPRDCRLGEEVLAPALEGEQKPALEKEMKIAVVDPARLSRLSLFVDPEMLRVVFANLISNAVKYGFPGGYIQIDFRETDDAFVFNVKNSGEGVPPDKLEEIFEKFKRLEGARSKQKGTGLGLFNAKVIVELHGGKIWAESAPGKWANFCFSLPKARVSSSTNGGERLVEPGELWGY